jgi:hypothetical protein
MTPFSSNPALVTAAPVETVCPMPIAQRSSGVTDRMPILRPDSLVDSVGAHAAMVRRCVNPLGRSTPR